MTPERPDPAGPPPRRPPRTGCSCSRSSPSGRPRRPSRIWPRSASRICICRRSWRRSRVRRTATTSWTTRACGTNWAARTGLRSLARTAREHGLGLVVDIVPNHMAMAPRHNRPLWEVLREGPDSPYARWFDIDWEAHGGQVLLPVLGQPARRGERPPWRWTATSCATTTTCSRCARAPRSCRCPSCSTRSGTGSAWWRLARTELNYRRFFSISELIGVRVEDPEVFDGHPREDPPAAATRAWSTGCASTTRTASRTRTRICAGCTRRPAGAGRSSRRSSRTTSRCPPPGRSRAPPATTRCGTIDGLFTDPAGAGELLGQYRRFAAPQADRGGDWEATVRRAAYKVVTHELAAEVDRLTREAGRLCRASPDPALRDHAPWALRTALRELLVRLDVYRPYTSGDAAPVVTEEAADEARAVFTVPEEAAGGGRRTGPGARAGRRRARTRGVPGAVRADRVRAAGQVRGGHGVLPATCPCCRRPRWAGTRGARPCPRRTSTRTARACSATGPPPAPSCRRTTPSAAPTYGPRSPCSRSVPSAGPTLAGRGDRADGGDGRRPTRRWRGRRGRRWSGSARPDGGAAPGRAAEARPGGGAAHRAGPSRTRRTRTRWRRSWRRARAGRPGGAWPRSGPPLAPHVRANVLGAALVHLTMPGVPDVYQGTEGEYRALVDPDNRRARSDFPPVEAGTACPTRGRAHRRRAAAAPGGARRLRRRGDVRTADGAGPGRRALCGVRALRGGGHGRHPAVAAAGGGGRLARHACCRSPRAGGPICSPRGGSSRGTRAWRSFSSGCPWCCWSGSAQAHRKAPR